LHQDGVSRREGERQAGKTRATTNKMSNGMNKAPFHSKKKKKKKITDSISEPLRLHIVRIPYILREIRRTFIHIDKLHELRVEMRIAERFIRHERVIKVLWIV
jgi:hypothetical protein